MATINLGNIPDNQEFEPIPEDRYNLECVKAELTKAKSSGNNMIKAEFKITSDTGFKNRRVFANFPLVQKALFNLKNYFDATGIDTSGELEEAEIADLILGTTAEAFIKAETYTANDGSSKVNYRPESWKKIGTSSTSLFA